MTTGATSHASSSKTVDATMVEEEEEGGDVVTTELDYSTLSGSTTENDIIDDPEI